MDLELTDDQEMFRATTRRFLEAESPISRVRELESDPTGFDEGYWRRGAELGWSSLLIAEADGGGSLSGDGLRDLAVIVEELGRLVAPGPLIPTSLVAAAVAAEGTPAQRAALLPAIARGDAVGAWAFAERATAVDPGRLEVTAERVESGYRISGTKTPVEAGVRADVLLVTASTSDGPTTFLVPADTPGVGSVVLGSLDLVKRFAEVRFDDVVVSESAVVGEPGGAGALAEHLVDLAATLTCAELCGATDRVLEFTLDYVGDRFSFGRPLASYQALKHRFADMKMWLEGCQGITTAAVRAVASGAGDAAELASAAKAYVGPRSTEIIQDCIQLHGGIGVTWEHDLHLYLRRATVGRGLYGSPVDHRERIAPLLGMGAIPA